MKRLIKKSDNLGKGWGDLITTYRNNALAFITYDVHNVKFHVFLSQDKSVPQIPSHSVDIEDMKQSFEEAEMYVIESQREYGPMERTKTQNPKGFDLNDSIQWENFEKGNQIEEDSKGEEKIDNAEKNDRGYKTVELHFYEKDIEVIRELVKDLTDKNLMDNYSIAPLSIAASKFNYRKVYSVLDKLFFNRKLKKIVQAYNYYNVLEYISDSFIKDFYHNIDVNSVYFTEENAEESSYSADGFIVKYNDNYISFGATAENDILEIQERLSVEINQYEDGFNDGQYFGYPIDRFIQELQVSPIGSISLFNNFDEAEKFILDLNSNIKHKIALNDNYENTTNWLNYQETYLNLQEVELVEETNQVEEIDNVEEVEESQSKQEEIDINEHQDDELEDKVMRIRIHYDNKLIKKTEDYLKKWIDDEENKDIVFNYYKNKPSA